MTGSRFGRSAGGQPPSTARVHEASGRPVREYNLRAEITHILNAADPNIFIAGGRSGESLLGLFDIRAPGEMPQRLFAGLSDVQEMNLARNPGTELSATPRYVGTSKIFDVGTGNLPSLRHRSRYPRIRCGSPQRQHLVLLHRPLGRPLWHLPQHN